MKSRWISIVIVCLLTIMGFLGFITFKSDVVSAGNTIFVGTGPGNSTNSIQDAIDNFASEGDTVFVYGGIYVEHVVVDKTLNLTGENMDTTIIDGGGSGDVVYISANWVNVSNFKVTNGGDGIELFNVSNCKIFSCNVSNMMDLGIGLGSSTSITIANNSVSNTYEGIILTSSNSNTIMYNYVWNNTNGIHIRFDIAWPTSADDNTITNNHVSLNSGDGIYIKSSSNNTIAMNEVFNNNYGMHVRESSDFNFISNNNVSNSTINGIYLSKLSKNTVINNKISNSGGNGIYLFSASNSTLIGNELTNNSYGLYLTSSSKNNTLIGNNLSNNDYGIHLGLSFNNTIADNDVYSNNFDGIRLYSSSKNNTIIDNKVISNNRHGIYLNLSSSNNQIINNEIFSNLRDGIHLSESSNDLITENYILMNNGTGIKLIFSSNNIITKNNISSNIDYGVNLSSSSINNKIYHNDFINNNNSNSPQAFDASSNGNNWDNVYPSGGNYWSDFDEPSEGAYDDYQGLNQNILGNDGIVDNGSAAGGGKNPYVMDDNSKDYYPLTNPVDKIPPTITNLQPPNFSTTNKSRPKISADYSDFSGINISSVIFKVDDVDETANATVTANNITYTPSSGIADDNHTIYLEVKDIWDNIAIVSWTFIVDTTPPGTIIDLSTSNITNDSITLTWTAPGDDNDIGTAAGYIVKYTTSGVIIDSNWDSATTYNQSWLPLGVGNTETHVISGLSQGTQYWFAIKGYDEVQNYADISNSPDGTTLTIPTAPKNLRAISGDRSINLTWEAPSSNGGSIITMYNIYRDDKPGVYVMVPSGQLLYRDINVMNGVSYTYNVSAVNSVGEGPKSIGVSAKPVTIPSAPQNLEASAGDGYIYLTWSSPISSGGSPITNYRIYRGSGPGQKTFLAEIGKIRFYNDTDVTNSITYYYIVSCVNVVGESSFSDEVNATPDKDTDGDSIPNHKDWDDDNDGYLDEYDDFPLNSSEWLDTDGDGVGNNADPDDDDDGYLDDEDADPLDPNIWEIPKEKKDSDSTWIWILIAAIIIICIIALVLILRIIGPGLGKKGTEEEESELPEQKEIKEP